MKNLITGDTGEFDQDFAQVYLGKSLKLKSICQTKKARSLGINPHRIAKIAVGDKTDELSPLINGSGMDLDNIDNICRAVSAMGIMEEQIDFAELAAKLASSFVMDNGKIFYNKKYAKQIDRWLKMRDIQYTEIYRSVEDFSYQAMIKKAIQLLGDSENDIRIEKNLWRLTDSEFTYQYLLKNPQSKELMERVLLCRPYSLLAMLYVRGEGCIQYINTHIREIEKEIGSYLSIVLGLQRYEKEDLVLVNFYPDKRHRWIPEERWIGYGEIRQAEKWEEGAILGFFTPAKVVGYATDSKSKNRSLKRFDNKNVISLIEKTQDMLRDFEVMEYGEEKRRDNSTINGESQLGFWGL